MPTIIYDRDNPQGRPSNAGDSSSGVTIYAVDPSTDKVEVTLDGVPIARAEVIPVEKPPVTEKPKRTQK